MTDLPVVLPLELQFEYGARSPLAEAPSFYAVSCPRCRQPARRETDTMDTFVDSSWYFERYTSPHANDGPFDVHAVDYWMPVDLYIGGIEHAVLHLLYARFWTKVLRDLGLMKYDEPFTRLLTQGMVCMETLWCPQHEWLFPTQVRDGTCVECGRVVTVGRMEKMSKSKHNVVDPDEMIQQIWGRYDAAVHPLRRPSRARSRLERPGRGGLLPLPESGVAYGAAHRRAHR